MALKTVKIGTGDKAKDYVMAHERIKYFRENYPDGKILTEIVSHENGVVIMKTSIAIGNEIVATGHAYEIEGNGFINKFSYIENCETSCVARALGNFGIGIDDGFASYEEVANAKLQQENELMSYDDYIELFKKDQDAARKAWSRLYQKDRKKVTEFINAYFNEQNKSDIK